MKDELGSVARLIDELKKLPGIGQKSAQRIAFHLLKKSKEESQQLARTILDVKERIRFCSVCNNFTETDPCVLCTSPSRDDRVLCIIEQPQNVTSIERTGGYKGRYHVLHGALSPMEGIGPSELKLDSLLERVRKQKVEEAILATNPNVEGEATAHYLFSLLKPLGIRVTRIALGVPVGSDLELADEVTLSKALEGRREL
ncbi:MAG: recombination protein RecR [Acidobacteria bacterium]|nr:recombination protein RecR [Acidobacteriota bacterium]